MNPAPPPQGDEAEARLFGDSLSCDVELPVAVEPASSRGRQAQAITLLSALAQIEDLRKKDDAGEEHGDLPLLAQRMDAKLDLVLALLGRLVRQSSPGLPALPLRWSVHGVRLELPAGPEPDGHGHGLVRLQPSEWLPDSLELPATVLATASAEGRRWLWLRFADLPPGLEDALERQLFRMHRREVAARRR